VFERDWAEKKGKELETSSSAEEDSKHSVKKWKPECNSYCMGREKFEKENDLLAIKKRRRRGDSV